MAKIEVTINGKAYPCSQTMGAMLRFKEQTGKEITEMDAASFNDQVTFLWCCVKSACAREKIPFDLSLMEFADSIEPEEMAAWNKAEAGAVQQAPEGDTPKESSPPVSTICWAWHWAVSGYRATPSTRCCRKNL